MPYGPQIWWEPLTRANAMLGVKGHAGVSQGQLEVKLLTNALWTPDLVGRTPDQSVNHCWGQRSCRGQPGSTRGQNLYKYPVVTKFGRKDLRSECNALMGLKVLQESAGVNQRQNCLEMSCALVCFNVWVVVGILFLTRFQASKRNTAPSHHTGLLLSSKQYFIFLHF